MKTENLQARFGNAVHLWQCFLLHPLFQVVHKPCWEPTHSAAASAAAKLVAWRGSGDLLKLSGKSEPKVYFLSSICGQVLVVCSLHLLVWVSVYCVDSGTGSLCRAVPCNGVPVSCLDGASHRCASRYVGHSGAATPAPSHFGRWRPVRLRGRICRPQKADCAVAALY